MAVCLRGCRSSNEGGNQKWVGSCTGKEAVICRKVPNREVAEWLFEKGTLKREDVVQARVVKEANLQLEAGGAGTDNFVRRSSELGRLPERRAATLSSLAQSSEKPRSPQAPSPSASWRRR